MKISLSCGGLLEVVNNNLAIKHSSVLSPVFPRHIKIHAHIQSLPQSEEALSLPER